MKFNEITASEYKNYYKIKKIFLITPLKILVN